MNLRLSCLFLGVATLSSCGPFSGVGSYTYPYASEGIPFDENHGNGGQNNGAGTGGTNTATTENKN